MTALFHAHTQLKSPCDLGLGEDAEEHHQVMHHGMSHARLVPGAAAIARHMWVQHRGQKPERRWPEGGLLVVTVLHQVEPPGIWTLRGEDLGSG
jgi:hypothetical protein